MSWELVITDRARRDLRRIEQRERQAIRDVINQAVLDPGSVNLRKLRGTKDEWRIRYGRWRIIQQMDNQRGVMVISRILPRDQAYR